MKPGRADASLARASLPSLRRRGRSELAPTLGSPSFDDRATRPSPHPNPKPMGSPSPHATRLVGSLHFSVPARVEFPAGVQTIYWRCVTPLGGSTKCRTRHVSLQKWPMSTEPTPRQDESTAQKRPSSALKSTPTSTAARCSGQVHEPSASQNDRTAMIERLVAFLPAISQPSLFPHARP